MPHLIQGWAVPLRGISREGQVLEVLEFLRGLRGRGGKAVATIGGVDFVSHFAEMGSYDIMAAFAALPSGWEQLVSRFDDMHKVMFGPPRMFDHISQREIRQAFTSIERLGAKSRELVMAVARTTGRGRRFAKRPAHLIVA
jgi:hypothetical protein